MIYFYAPAALYVFFTCLTAVTLMEYPNRYSGADAFANGLVWPLYVIKFAGRVARSLRRAIVDIWND